jgi:drug/metabolite transporter (DMT)-like permease
MIYAICIVFAASLAVGQILFKLAADSIGKWQWSDGFFALLSPYLIAALALYAATTILWVYILTRLPLSTAYPFSIAGSVAVILLSLFFLGETPTFRQGLGIAIVYFGLFVIYF